MGSVRPKNFRAPKKIQAGTSMFDLEIWGSPRHIEQVSSKNFRFINFQTRSVWPPKSVAVSVAINTAINAAVSVTVSAAVRPVPNKDS